MAEKKNNEPKKSGSKKGLIIGLVLLLVLGIGGAVTWYFLLPGEEAESTNEAAPVVRATPIYHDVKAPFIVNFAQQSNNQVRYLQIKLKMMARDQAIIDAVALHEPAITHELLMLFYSQNYDDLSTSEGTQALQESSLTTINQLLSREGYASGIEAVYFTNLVMQ